MRIEDYHKQRIAAAFTDLTLAELQILLLGLWVIGEENRVDPTMTVQYGWLVNALGARANLRVNAAVAGVPQNSYAAIQGDVKLPDPPSEAPTP